MAPIALRFDAEDDIGSLPAVADLAARHGAGPIMATLGLPIARAVSVTDQIPAIVTGGAASVQTKIESRPTRQRRDRDRGRRLGVNRGRREIGRDR